MNGGYEDIYCVIIFFESIYMYYILKHLLNAWILRNYNLHSVFLLCYV